MVDYNYICNYRAKLTPFTHYYYDNSIIIYNFSEHCDKIVHLFELIFTCNVDPNVYLIFA